MAPNRNEGGAPGWARDASGRHEYRYWDGQCWTSLVADGGRAGTDPDLPDAPPTQIASSPNRLNDLEATPLTTDSFFDDPRRVGSSDVAFGDQWRSSGDPGAIYRLYWLQATGECFLVRADWVGGHGLLGAEGFILALLQRHPHPTEYRVEVLIGGLGLEDVRQRLCGWEAAMVGPNSLEWVRQRLS